MIRIIEVGPRDGLQNEAVSVGTGEKAAFIGELAASGLEEIEATSFVSPKWVPQLADAAELWPALSPGPKYSALVPNLKGLERALEVGVRRIAVFTAASESFTKRNINQTISESLAAFRDVVARFRGSVADGWIRGYISTAFDCPFEGRVQRSAVVRVATALLDLGVDELSVGDTIGVAVPKDVAELTRALEGVAPLERLAYHFHDTRGTAIANVAAALDLGVGAFDSSAAGLGGCPYAPGAGGNLATEDLVYFLERSGIRTGVNLERLARASLPILGALGRAASSKSQLAILAVSPPTR